MDADLLWNLLNLAGFAMSVYAAWAASTAKVAARTAGETVVDRKNDEEESDRFRKLIGTLYASKDAAMRRKTGAPAFLSAGHGLEHDRHQIEVAYDGLVTALPSTLDSQLRRDTVNAAADLRRALEAIETSSKVDGWKSAFATLQTLIPRLEQEDRRQKDRRLLVDLG